MTRASPDSDTPSASATVLIVEDEPDVRDIYELRLQQQYQVKTASDGDVDLGLIDDEIDIVFSDRRMPGTSGDELLARVRNHGIEVPFVMVSAVDSDVDLPDGLTEYFTKPVAGSDLIACVEQHVSDPVAMQESHSG